MNRHMIIGNLVRDPERGTTPTGANYTRFVVAVNRRRARDGEPSADYIRVTTWGTVAENCAKYLKKGQKTAVIGESRAYGWTGQDGTVRAQIELNAVDVEFLGGGRSPESGGMAPGTGEAWPEAAARRDSETGMQAVDPDDLPY